MSVPQPSSPPSHITGHRYLLDDSTTSTITLPDGRDLCYAEYGSPTGIPILYMHGFPSSRIEGAGFDPLAVTLGARIISIDRPGYGRSTPHPARTLLSTAQDVAVLASHLKLEKYGILGISGGGPYALACAKVLPVEQLRAVAIVCGLGPPDLTYTGMNWMSWLGWTYGQRYFPGLCRWWFSRDAGARLDLSEEVRLDMMRKSFESGMAKMHPKDAAVLGDVDFMRMHIARGREVYRQGLDGMSQDFRLLNSDFGFKMEDIRKDLPVHVWHGDMDDMVPPRHGEEVAKRLGNYARLNITHDTHASIWPEQMENYLGQLVKGVEGLVSIP